MVITKAIKKYGVDNFFFELLERGLSIEEAEEKEIFYIKNKNTLVPNGYNIETGGKYAPAESKYGYENNNAHLTKEEAQYIKDNRNIPIYVLYEEFNEKISYESFMKIYHDKTYPNVKTTTEEYPYNLEFSCQFNASPLDYGDVVELRNRYANGEYWLDVYKEYQDIYTNKWSFWNLYNGNSMKLVMPEVFTIENKRKHSSIMRAGEKNGRAKLKDEDVLFIRQKFKEGWTREQLLEKFPNCTRPALNCVLSGKTWKHLL